MRFSPKLSWMVLGLACLASLGCSSTSTSPGGSSGGGGTVADAEHAVYRSMPSWQYGIYRNRQLLTEATPSNTSIQISLKEQRGLLLVHNRIAMDFPVATGKPSHPTPTGHFTIMEKIKDYHSNIYGRTFDQYGNIVLPDADRRTDPIPEGGRFVQATMTDWMRLTSDGVGLHVGYIPGGGRAASHGCIRLQENIADQLFALTQVGTSVTIAEQAPALP